MERIFITQSGYDSADAELGDLLTRERPAIIKAIAEARSHGDLKENAEYHSAKEKQGMIEARISQLKSIIARAEIVEIDKLSGAVKFGATVTIEDDDTEEVNTYQIVSEYEADTRKGSISVKTVLARALMGREVGDSVEVQTPVGERSYTVLEIRYR